MASADANESAAEAEDQDAEICIAQSRPGRTVFSESGNPDGWIGTDLVVEIER
ncbi:hypothetical protein L593_03920 [Salinarchaeum sp. Harcht-Bsk1]|uniref:hypothetical protein n=1 Tax=Salinarchaeum sp. Harcht-Bsk1 TaxID=1333523 RepID=UPI0003423E4A|nr:hypothetical protein [Salinarchaeum sp. Harcht-Bsk1]AGN00735.1 hypothetical protein L593_03920 [Salinarchaeum sp. Harcht-Bsk1]